MTNQLPTMTDSVTAAADRLRAAGLTRTPCAPVRDLIGSADLAAAYGVQQRNIDNRVTAGAIVVGRKIGLTSHAVQRQLGVDQPDFGVLLDDMQCASDTPIAIRRLLQPKVEAEIAFVLAEDLTDGPFHIDRIRAAIAYAVAALEIVDSRIANWNITFGDTVADNGSSGLFVLGNERRSLEEFEPIAAQMHMAIDGIEVSSGTGAACLGDPLNAVAWLAQTASEFGSPLRAGDVILSGALGPMAPVTAGNTVTAQVSGLGAVTATFTQE